MSTYTMQVTRTDHGRRQMVIEEVVVRTVQVEAPNERQAVRKLLADIQLELADYMVFAYDDGTNRLVEGLSTWTFTRLE